MGLDAYFDLSGPIRGAICVVGPFGDSEIPMDTVANAMLALTRDLERLFEGFVCWGAYGRHPSDSSLTIAVLGNKAGFFPNVWCRTNQILDHLSDQTMRAALIEKEWELTPNGALKHRLGTMLIPHGGHWRVEEREPEACLTDWISGSLAQEMAHRGCEIHECLCIEQVDRGSCRVEFGRALGQRLD